MQIITLYRYERENGGVTVSPNKPDVECTEMYRLVADEGKVITKDGMNTAFCTDVEATEGWYEIDEPIDGTEEITDDEVYQKAHAYDILTGEVNT